MTRRIIWNNCFGPYSKFSKLNPKKSWLLSASRFSRDKCLNLAVEAFFQTNLKDWQLILSGKERFEDELIGLVRKYLANSRVAILFTPPVHLPALFSCADAFIHVALPTEEFIDSRPSSVTTAAFYGKPVIFPLAQEGGVSESLSAENISNLGFEIGANREETVRNIVQKIRLLENQRLLDTIGEVNKVFAAKFK